MSDSPPQPTRRRFLSWFLGTSVGALLAAIFYPIARFISPPAVAESSTNEVDAGPTNDPEFVSDAFKIIRFGSEPVIVIRVAETDFRAFTATCTHLACIVEYRRDRELIWCNCHNGVYDLTGRNIAGPPPRPLTPFDVHLVSQGADEAEMVVVSRRG